MRIPLFDPPHMISIFDLVAISVEISRIHSGYSLEKELTKLIHRSF